MEKNIRSFIEEEYKKTLTELKENKEVYAKNEAYINLKKEVMKEYFSKESARNQIIASPLLMIVLNALAVFIMGAVPESVPELLIEIPSLILNTSLVLVLISSAKDYKKHKKGLNEKQEELAETYYEYGDCLVNNEITLRYDRERQDDLRQKIYLDETYAKGLYVILQDEDLAKKINEYNHSPYQELFKKAFDSEWDNYIEEINKIHTENIHLSDKETLKKVEPIALKLTSNTQK